MDIRENKSNSRAPVAANAPEADAIFDWTLAKMRECYPGDDSLAEVVTIRAREWVRDEGYSVAEVMSAINNAIGAGIGGGGFIRWAHKNLVGSRKLPAPGPRPASIPAEPEVPRFVATDLDRRIGEAMRRRPAAGGPR